MLNLTNFRLKTLFENNCASFSFIISIEEFIRIENMERNIFYVSYIIS